MEYKSENRICQNCKKDFTIEPDDFGFYEKIKVPPPTFCPWCRMIRRFAWRNERVLHRRNCSLCKKSIIAMYSKTVPFPVYCRECWYGDGWDPTIFGRDYDFSRNFFEQYHELSKTVPRVALWQRNVINSDYSNMAAECKNAYLSVSVVKNSENIFYSKLVDKSKDIVDCFNVLNGCEGLYENVEAQSNYNSQYLLLSRSCINSFYLVDCANCSNCFMSYNLRNKKFCIRNVQFTESDYFKELNKINLKSRVVRQNLFEEFTKIKKEAIYRFSNYVKSVDSTGNNLLNVKNCKNCFEAYNAENLKYSYRAFDIKDCMDFDYGQRSELTYEYTTGALNAFNVKFSYSAMDSLRDADYTESCINCKNLFGCISLRNKDYAIFNKVYSKEEYTKLRAKIINHMSEVPFVDDNGIKYEYGEFFPMAIIPFGYNETLAQEFMPLTKDEALEKGYPWRDIENKNFKITMNTDEIPENIDKVTENILQEVIECAHNGGCLQQCTTAFRLTDYELKFYKKYNIPIPTLCHNCRYYERIKDMPALKLWKRLCVCAQEGHFHGDNKCDVEFETPYSPNQPEKVYCEKCYQQEVY